MRRVFPIAAGALALIAATAPDQPISFSLSSWGHPLVQWTIAPDGQIRFSYRGKSKGKGEAGIMVTGTTRPDRRRYRSLEHILAPAREFVGKELPCTRAITDMPYGDVQWGSGAAVHFDAGFDCPTEESKAAMRAVTQANDQVRNWVVPAN